MKKYFIVFLAMALAVVFISCKQKNGKQKTKPRPIIAQPVPVKTARFDFDILAEIKKAQALLEKEDAGYYLKEEKRWAKVKGKKGAGKKGKKAPDKIRRWKVQKLDDFNVLLAVENTEAKERNIEIIKLKNKGKKSPRGFSVDFPQANGLGTQFDVAYPDGYAVLGIKRVIRDGKVFREVVNTPYTKSIDCPELYRAGLDYLKENLDTAEKELNSKVASRAFVGSFVAEIIPLNTALVLSVIEHVDPNRFERGEPMEKLINETLITIGANQDRAYRYSVSKAGARGLFQFIPRTYQSVRRQYPMAKLMPDFRKGMDNHLNAAKASLLLFDSDLCCMKKEQRMVLRNNPEAMGKFLAAAYNGGAKRATNAIEKYGSKWETHLLPETVIYLQKFKSAWKIIG